jgi:cytochrome P450
MTDTAASRPALAAENLVNGKGGPAMESGKLEIAEELNTTVPSFYAHPDRADLFRRLRHDAPVSFHPELPCTWIPEGGRGYWAVTRHGDIRAITRNPKLFSSAAGTNPQDEPEFRVRALGMLHMDDPEHRAYRAIVGQAFALRHIVMLEPMITALADDIIDGLIGGKEIDIVSDVVNRYPVGVIAILLGLPECDFPMFVENTRLAFGPDREAGARAHKALIDYGTALAEIRRREPGDDLVTRIVKSEYDSRKLTDLEVGGFVSLLIGAGAETTGSTLAFGLQLLSDHPDQWQALKADRQLLPNAVDEIIRMASAVINFRRNATEDCVLGDQQIRKGDKVVLFYESGNYDESVFDAPERFDIHRTNARLNVSFGAGGPHQCLGEQLGKREIAIFLSRLLQRTDKLEVIERAGFAPSPRFNMIKTMRVRFA